MRRSFPHPEPIAEGHEHCGPFCPRVAPHPAFRPTAAVWFDANGHTWGYIGHNGERLDQGGNPIEEEIASVRSAASRVRVAVAVGLLLLFAALLIGVVASQPYRAPSPGHTPTTYGPPPT